MCEQTEINYLDGDIVWVKLGASWWPGQVTGFHNLPEDIQNEFQKKPLIAAVKFFQEDTYEFVKNYQQIYKYNCTQKDDFIRKGLDKYRSKSKDGASYMDKFPGDVEMAEKLTGGDPEILSSEKFSPEEKPDISALFGEKKIPKKKKERDDMHRRSEGTDLVRKITHPRFLKESDHEVRIRQQPSSLPSTPNSAASPQYPCHSCNFTSSRVNVIICHIKSHRSGNSPMARSKVKTYAQLRGRLSDSDTPKRKYVRKEKHVLNKSKNEGGSESGKRKQPKQSEKITKKKKTDPELREKLLADWDDESDEEASIREGELLTPNSINTSSAKELAVTEEKEVNEVKCENLPDTNELIAETEKLLKETESTVHVLEDSFSSNIRSSKGMELDVFDKKSEFTKSPKLIDLPKDESTSTSQKDKEVSDNESKYAASDKEDKKSRLSCFDFDEDDIPEPSIPPVRKIPRVFGDKNLSLKKEIIKEFEMSQALKTMPEKETENDKTEDSDMELSMDIKNVKLSEAMIKSIVGEPERIDDGDAQAKIKNKTVSETDPPAVKTTEDPKRKIQDESQTAKDGEEAKKSNSNRCDTELEIVEIFEVEREEADDDGTCNIPKVIDHDIHSDAVGSVTVNNNETPAKNSREENSEESSELMSAEIKESPPSDASTANAPTATESSDNASAKEGDDTLSEQLTTETEDETVSESAETLPEQSETSDTDVPLSIQEANLVQAIVKRKRGRPRKSLESSDSSSSRKSNVIRAKDKEDKRLKSFEQLDKERKTSESDTDRSYTGRKRKPNKKYLESALYIQDTDQKPFKTDDSMSESDDKMSEKRKSKVRRGRTSTAGSKKKNVEVTTKQSVERELELSDQLLDMATTEEDSRKIEVESGLNDGKIGKGKVFVGLERKLVESQSSLSTRDQLTATKEVLPPVEKTDVDLSVDIVKLAVSEKKAEDNNLTGSVATSECTKDDNANAKNVSTLIKNGIIEERTDAKEHAPSMSAADTSAGKVDTPSRQLEPSRTMIEMLPPKKSQIKKFEMSQIDFFDTDNSTTSDKPAAVPEVEENIKQLDVMEVEITGTNQNDDVPITIPDTPTVEVDTVSKCFDVERITEKTKDALPMEEDKGTLCQVKGETSKKVESIPQETDGESLEKQEECKLEIEQTLKDNSTATNIDQSSTLKRSTMQTRYKGKFIPETGTKSKKDKEPFVEEKPVNTFQEAFLKTLQMDKKKAGEDPEAIVSRGKKGKKSMKKKIDDTPPDNVNVAVGLVQDANIEKARDTSEVIGNLSNLGVQENVSSEVSQVIGGNFEGVEVVVEENVETESKEEDTTVFQNIAVKIAPSPEFVISAATKSQSHPTMTDENLAKPVKVEVQKVDDSSRMSMSTPSPTSDLINVPVKKREMPRIIENVTLTEPMQILKSKLLDKLPQKGVKHKLEHDVTKKYEAKGSPKAKMMKIEAASGNSKLRTGLKVTSPHLSLTKKLQVLKAEEAETAALMETQNDKLNVQTGKTMSAVPPTEKCIQQSSQSLADMELDINSMPFVLSEDVLTPESIEQMPVVISSIIPASSTIPATLSFSSSTQMVTTNQTQFKLTSDSTTETSPTKKKSGTPAILKNKTKAKPTITSIKTLVPPLTGGVKGLKFQSAQIGKAGGTPGKYVVVQTAGCQQLRYSVQAKSTGQQKVATIPVGKGAANAQVVQQGGKVVILTSAQSDQNKALSLNISKTLGGKIQRIVTSKAQLLCPISSQGLIASKPIIAPKDAISPATSKLIPTHKVINPQGLVTSKKVTPIPATISRTALLGTLSQGILTRGGIYTPISASPLAGKAIIGSKTLVTQGAILSSSNLSSSKAILTPVSKVLTGQAILSAQGIITTKGAILTPITGQQVKALAARSPSRVSRLQYQSVSQKVQLPMLQKSLKTPIMSGASQARGSAGALKSPDGSTITLQNPGMSQKGTQSKKNVKSPALQQHASGNVQTISVQNAAGQQQSVNVIPQVQHKGKTTASSVQKVIISRSGRQAKNSQKVLQKTQETPVTSTVQQSSHSKQSVTSGSMSTSTITKSTAAHHKQTVGSITAKSPGKAYAGSKNSQQKNILTTTMSMNSVNVAAATTAANVTNANLSSSLPLPPLEPVEPERKLKIDSTVVAEATQKEHQLKVEKHNVEKKSEAVVATTATEKVDEPKLTTQPQIMALPTESSDGTQTYVLVTIDEQGQIQPLDNNTLMSLEGTTQNPDGTRTLYIDPSSLGEAGTLDNIVLQFDNGVLPNMPTAAAEANQAIIPESFPASEIIQTSNQDILAAALANTDFQQEINLSDNTSTNVMTTGLTQTSLINQTILQSTIIPPTEPISSPSVLETSLTLNQPIMTPLEVPSSLPIQSEQPPASVVSTIPSSLELPIAITNPSMSYISSGEPQLQMPGNSMPDIGEIMESPSTADIARQTEMPVSTQYLVIPNLDENIPVEAPDVQNVRSMSVPAVSYSVSIPSNMVLETTQVQTTPSMPIIDDTYAENVQFGTTMPTASSIMTEQQQSFVDVPVSEMLLSKASSASTTSGGHSQDDTVSSEMLITTPHDVSVPSEEPVISSNEARALNETQDVDMPMEQVYSSQDIPATSGELILQQTIGKENNACSGVVTTEESVGRNESVMNMEIDEQQLSVESMSSSMPIIDESSLVTTPEPSAEVHTPVEMAFEVTDSKETQAAASTSQKESETVDKLKRLTFKKEQRLIDNTDNNNDNDDDDDIDDDDDDNPPLSASKKKEIQKQQVLSAAASSAASSALDGAVSGEIAEVDEAAGAEIYTGSTVKSSEESRRDEPSSQGETDTSRKRETLQLHFEESNAEATHEETPSQSYEQFDVSMTGDTADLPSQSATKSENSREPSQSITYEPTETDEGVVVAEPPSQSFEHSKINEASQSYETSAEANTNAPTQSFNEIIQNQEERTSLDEAIDDQSFPTQSYEVGKTENLPETLETDAEISQEGNIPSQSNDIGTDGIGTSSISTNNSGLNEDETASSSYVPETPENQERDQDQESAISTSSYEIPPCEELNIATSSVIPDTSVRGEHTSIHDNGVPEIPTSSSYNLNPDITSTHVDAVPTSSYEDQVIVEQNVSTSYDVPISMPGLDETSSQNFVAESTDQRNEPSSYYAHHQEVTASYYESVDQESNSRIGEDPQEEVTPSYYERNPQEASQSYFTAPEEATPSYTGHNMSPTYYDHRPESEASQSYYSTDDLEKTEQSSSQNIEASQSFYQEGTDELRLRQQGEATPTYSERYPVDYTLDNSPIERHDLVESSVPATRPTER